MRLFTWENYLQANVNKEDAKAIWKVCFKFHIVQFTCYGFICINLSNNSSLNWDLSLNILNFYIQIGNSIECSVDPASLKATVTIPVDTKEVMLLYCLDILQMVLKWGNFVIYQTLEHAHADQQRPLKLFTHGFRDSTIETETTYFVPGEFFGLLLNFVVGETGVTKIHL